MTKEIGPLRQKKRKVGITIMALASASALGISAFALTPTQSFSDQEMCVTATRVDDSKIFATNCEPDEVTPSPEITETALPTASPSATTAPTSAPVPTPTPTPTPPPIVLGPGVANGEVFVRTASTVYDLRQMAPLNDGGMIAIQADGVWLTPRLRVDPIKITGYDATKLATPLGVEASADGQTIAIFSDRYIQVSWDGGKTWLAPQEQMYYSIGYFLRDVTVPENGGSVITVGETGTKDPTLTTRAMSLVKGGTWKNSGLIFGYKPFMSTDGVTALQAVLHQRITKSITVAALTVTNNSLPSSNFVAFATSGNFSTQIATMDSTDSKLSLADRALALRISRDGGLTWKIISFGSFTNLQVSSDGQKMVTVDSSNTMRLSTDNGQTWNVIDPIGNGVKAGKVEMAPDGKSMLIMGTDSKTYQTSVTQVIP